MISTIFLLLVVSYGINIITAQQFIFWIVLASIGCAAKIYLTDYSNEHDQRS